MLVFAAAFFVAGWVHVHGRSGHRGGLLRAAANILASCSAFGVIPGLIFGPWTFLHTLEFVTGALIVGLTALPSALLLVHAYGRRQAPRAGSILAGADRAEDALALTGSMLLLPWWRSGRAQDVALILVLVALPAVAVGIHALVLAKQATLLGAAFPRGATSCAREATIVGDVGYGDEEREALVSHVGSYRSAAVGQTLVCRGDARQGARAALRLLCFSFGVCVAAAAQVSGLLMG